MGRLVHRATDELPAEAGRAMVAGFRGKKTYRAIAQDLAALGVRLAERTVARRGQEWREEEARRRTASEQMRALIAAMKAEEMNAAEIVHALGVQALLEDPEEWRKRDPLQAEELRIKRETLEVRKRQVELGEKKLVAMQEREARARAEVEELTKAPGQALTVEQVNRMRELYGLGPVGAG